MKINNVVPANMTPSEFRQYKAICAAVYAWRRREKTTYSNCRGSELKAQFKPPPYVLDHLDCSAFVTYCYYVAGAKDPNNHGYDFWQISTSPLWANGRFIGGPDVKLSRLQPGDLIFYGYNYPTPMAGGNSEHVTIYIDDGKCISMGSDDGPSFLDWNVSSKPLFGVRRYVF